MECVSPDRALLQILHLLIGDLDALLVGAGVESGLTVSPVVVVVAAIVSTMTSWLVSGLPRQFMEIWAKSRCSIRFHFDVPGT